MRNNSRIIAFFLILLLIGTVFGEITEINMSSFWTSNSSPGFNFTPTSDLNNSFFCELIVDGIGSGTNSSVFNNTLTTIFSNKTISEGQKNWTIECTDFNSTFDSSEYVFLDFSTPQTSIFSPENNSWINNTTPTVNFSLIDNLDNEINYTIFVDGEKKSQGFCYNNTPENISLALLTEGEHNLTINSFDEADNQANKSIVFSIDSHAPFGIELISPEDLANTNNFINFSFFSLDNRDPVLNYTLYLKNYTSGIEKQEKIGLTSGNNTITNFTHVLWAGEYQWRIKFVDDAGNAVFSEYRFLTVNDTLPPTSAPVLEYVNDTNKDGNIEVNWSADPNATYYRIYRHNKNITTAENLTFINETNSTFFIDTDAAHGQTYWYALTSLDALKNENKSLVSNSLNITVNDTINPVSPKNLSAPKQVDGSIFLNWTGSQKDIQNNTDSAKYWIFRTKNNTFPNFSSTQHRIKITPETSFKDTTITTGENYSYYIISVDDALNKNTTISFQNSINKTAEPCETKFSKSAWSECMNGFRHRTLERLCYGGGETYIYQSEPCTPPPEGGGIVPGENQTQEEAPEQPPVKTIQRTENGIEIRWNKLSREMGIEINEENIPISSVSFKSRREKSQGPRIRIGTHENMSNPISREVYQYLSLESTYLFENEIDGDISIKFKVTNSWLLSNNLTSNRISLYRLKNNWTETPTRILGYDGEYYHYESRTQGFSYFSIAEKESQETISIDFPASYYESEEFGLSSFHVFFVFITLFSIVLGYYLFHIRKSRNW